MKRTMMAVSIVLSLLVVTIAIGPGAGGASAAALSASSGLATSGSVSSALYEGFEGAFPGSKWFVGDMDPNSGADYWGAAWTAEAARVHQGNWSGWCAEEGTNSPNMDVPNFSIRAYDYNMDAFMHLAWSSSIDMSAWDLAYLDFWAWCQTEPNADYLSLEWYDESLGTWVNTGSSQQITGTSGWTRYYWKTPYAYMTSGALFGFLFHSDFSEIGEGVYVDDINLMQADVTVESNSYPSADYARPGDSITLNYRIHNPAPFPVQCGLGARIAGIDAPVGYRDAAHESIVTVPSGYSWQTRTFTIPAGLPPEFGAPDGRYNVIFQIWSGAPEDTTNGNRLWGYSEWAGTLRVDSVAPPVPALISPANGATISDNTPYFDWSDVTDPSGVYYFIQVDNDADFSSPVIGTPPGGLEVPSSHYSAPSALADGRYYWRVATEDRLGNRSSFSTSWHFDLQTTSSPAVTTSAATGVASTSATLNGDLTAMGTASSVQVSFEWGLTTAYGTATTPQTMSAPAAFNSPISGLAPATTYHFRAKAVGDGTRYGDDLTFTTSAVPGAPSVTTSAATDVAAASATLNGDLTAMGTGSSVQVSFEWGLTTGYGTATAPQTMSGTGAFNSPISGLAPATTYHFRAKAVGDGTAYGEDLAFTTPAGTAPPSVTTSAATGVASTSATLNGDLTAMGTASSVQVSFEWGLTTAYGTATTPQTMSAPAAFNSPISGLAPATTYHFRAKAVGDGTTYGDDLTFTTSAAPGAPSVATSPATDLTASSATMNGDLTAMGTASSVQVSFVWGTVKGGPYPNETKASAQTATGAFQFNLTGLASATTFYYQARAVGNGTGFGAERSFTTSGGAGGAPIIVSLMADNGRPGDDLTVTITGSNLTGATAVTFGDGIAMNGFRVASDTEITVKISIDNAAEAGERDVTVTTPGGTVTAPGAFSVNRVGGKVHLWVYVVAVAGGLAVLGILATIAVSLQRRSAK